MWGRCSRDTRIGSMRIFRYKYHTYKAWQTSVLLRAKNAYLTSSPKNGLMFCGKIKDRPSYKCDQDGAPSRAALAAQSRCEARYSRDCQRFYRSCRQKGLRSDPEARPRGLFLLG